jgi:tRNA(fMet)-specific endonuclease VapC
MNGRYLLDTNVVIAFLIQDESVVDRPTPQDQLYVSSTIIGELYYGAFNSRMVEENCDRVEDFVRDTATIACDAETARIYGQVKMSLRKQGRPIPDNDIWIAAVAIQHGLTLVSRDEHFNHIDELKPVRW